MIFIIRYVVCLRDHAQWACLIAHQMGSGQPVQQALNLRSIFGVDGDTLAQPTPWCNA